MRKKEEIIIPTSDLDSCVSVEFLWNLVLTICIFGNVTETVTAAPRGTNDVIRSDFSLPFFAAKRRIFYYYFRRKFWKFWGNPGVNGGEEVTP